GKWKVVIDPVSIPSGTLTIDYTDIFTHSAFGSLAPLSFRTTLAKDANVAAEVVTKVDAFPAGNRRLVGIVELMNSEVTTTRYEYNATTKGVEPIKERVVLAEAFLDLQSGVNKPKVLTDAAAH